jgi:hypothetical protein
LLYPDLRLVHPDGREWARKSTPANNTARGKNFDQKTGHLWTRRRPRLDIRSAVIEPDEVIANNVIEQVATAT